MKNYIINLLLTVILVFTSAHSNSNTANFNSESAATKHELKMLSNSIYKLRLARDIDREYSTFYTKLDSAEYERQVRFINEIMCHALESKSLPSISIAQAILETGYGRYNKLNTNIFGIKGKGTKSKTKEFVNGRFITITSEFQSFRSLSDAFDRHYEIIGRYGLIGTDYVEWANKIQECGYATDPNYADKLVIIIERHELYRLDKIQVMNEEFNSIVV